MAIITEKNNKRYRVQFTAPRALHQKYEQCMAMAEKLGVLLDFSRDFEKWFSAQIDQVSRDLLEVQEKRLREAEEAQPRGKGPSTHPAPIPVPYGPHGHRELPTGNNVPTMSDSIVQQKMEVDHGDN